jgi:hypothetical protein
VAPDYILVHERQANELVLRIKKYIKEFYEDGQDKNHYGQVVSSE